MAERSATAGRRLNLLKPALRAYILGLLSVTCPQLLGLLISAVRGSSKLKDAYIRALTLIWRRMGLEQFPSACAVLIGGATLLPALFWNILSKSPRVMTRQTILLGSLNADMIIRFMGALISSLASFSLLNRRNSHGTGLSVSNDALNDHIPFTSIFPMRTVRYGKRRSSVSLSSQPVVTYRSTLLSPDLAGGTLDLTFLAIVHAGTILASAAWESRQSTFSGSAASKNLAKVVETLSIPTLFSLSSSIIMWAWFYTPERLPKAYNTWISSAARIDARLIEALRECRHGNFIYGEDTGLAPLLQGMCKDLQYPLDWGNPAKTIPIPCELYHSGSGPSCEFHALTRFVETWKFAMRMYLPLNLLMLLRRTPSRRSTGRAVVEASRSSAFLAAFTALFYYGVCCARTRLGPKLFSLTPTLWDSGLCVGTGCMFCGWSILLEDVSRRQEITLFVAPKALGTFFPREYDRKHLWRERLAFALSAAVILSTAQTRPRKVRGVFGRLLSRILE